MNPFSFLFNIFLYQPMLNILIWLYGLIGNFGVAIIILTLGLKAILHPINKKSIESQKVMTEIQPKMKAIQKKYKNNQQKQAEELVKLYQQEKFNPFLAQFYYLSKFQFCLRFLCSKKWNGHKSNIR